MGEFFNKIIRIIKGPDFRIFLVCLVISILIWSIEKLRQDYTYLTDYKINCINIPESYVFDESSELSISVVVKADGFNLLGISPGDNREVNLDVSTLSTRQIGKTTFALLPPSRSRRILSETLSDHIELVRVTSDTIYIPLLTLEKKLLPIKIDASVELENQHCYSSSTLVEPENVWVSGTSDKIDTMTAIHTTPHNMLILNDTLTVHYPFSLPDGVVADFDGVDVTYFVEPNTEKTLNIPITAINIPANYTFKAFPATAKVTFSIGLSQFEKIGVNDFDIIADLVDIRPGTASSKIKIKLANAPENISNVTYSPIFIEYLLEHYHEVEQ